MTPDFESVLTVLSRGGVEYVLIGGLAATVHGSARATYDVDIVYARSPDNLERLVRALEPHHPRLRGAPEPLPFRLDLPTLRMGLNFTLETDLGPLDLLGEVAGNGNFESLLPDSVGIELFGQTVRCVTLDRLIELKRAAARPKDFETIAELEALREERRPI